VNRTYSISVGKPEGKRPFRRPRRRWEDDIKMDRGLNSADSIQGAVFLCKNRICAYEQDDELWGYIKGGKFVDQVRDY
jgi:hypothetical protein